MIRFLLAVTASLVASAASAHITLESAQAKSGAGYKAVFRVSHGCDGTPTTTIKVTIPPGVIAVKPMPKPGWTIETTTGAYPEPYSYFGDVKVSEGVQEVRWSGGSLADAHYDEFIFRAYLAPELEGGKTVYFPVVQECQKGAHRWTEIPVDGKPAPAQPAPGVMLVAAEAKQIAAKAGALTIETPWMRATPGGAKVAGAYVKITNGGKDADRLVGGSLDGAQRFELHEMTMSGDTMKMRPLRDGIAIKPGETVELKPGGLHIMGLDLSGGYSVGQTVKGSLKFEKAGTVAVEFQVRPVGASDGASGNKPSGHQH